MACVLFLKPCGPFRAGDIAEVSDERAGELFKMGLARSSGPITRPIQPAVVKVQATDWEKGWKR